MASPIQIMWVVRYYRDGRPWDTESVESPTWPQIEAAIRRMDNYCFPIVQLNTNNVEWDNDIFNVFGGAGRWALSHMMGEWQYEDPTGDDTDVRLWDSDQGYFCKEKNVLRDITKVLRITRRYYDTGSYEGLDDIE